MSAFMVLEDEQKFVKAVMSISHSLSKLVEEKLTTTKKASAPCDHDYPKCIRCGHPVVSVMCNDCME